MKRFSTPPVWDSAADDSGTQASLPSARNSRGGRMRRLPHSPLRRARTSARLQVEAMEARVLLATIVVTGAGDTIATDGIVTLREAITAANTNAASGDASAGSAGMDTIAFNIPGSGIQTITLTSALPVISEMVTIDGYTQPGASPNTLAIGDNAVLLIEENAANSEGRAGLEIGGGGSTVRGLVLNRSGDAGISLQSSGNRIEGNFLGTDPTGTIARGNGSGITFSPNNNSGNTVGGTTPGARNLISGNNEGIHIGASDFTTSDRNVIQGNYIGTNAAGTAALGNHTSGIGLNGGTGNTIGGTISGAGNLISGNGVDGVFIGTITRLATNSHVIQGNFIGTDASGTFPLGNGEDGVFLVGNNPQTFGNTIGGLAAGAGNLIAFNGRSGISVAAGAGHAILSNFIHSNAGLGIAFGGGRIPTPNDPGDSDVGYNNGQNFPVVTSITSAGSSTTITGTLDSTPNTVFRIEFFANAAPDPSSFGEGKTFLGFADVTTDASGIANFTAILPGITIGPTQFVTSTATDPGGNTSEFSQLIADLGVTIAGAPATAVVGQDLTYEITVTNAGPFPAANTTLTDTIPANATFVSGTGGVTPNGGVVDHSPRHHSRRRDRLIHRDSPGRGPGHDRQRRRHDEHRVRSEHGEQQRYVVNQRRCGGPCRPLGHADGHTRPGDSGVRPRLYDRGHEQRPRRGAGRYPDDGGPHGYHVCLVHGPRGLDCEHSGTGRDRHDLGDCCGPRHGRCRAGRLHTRRAREPRCRRRSADQPLRRGRRRHRRSDGCEQFRRRLDDRRRHAPDKHRSDGRGRHLRTDRRRHANGPGSRRPGQRD